MAKKDKDTKQVAEIEIGQSGTNIFDGIIEDEYNPKLAGTTGIATYDVMRKSDATVKAVLLATSLPIRRANWFVAPASDDKKDKEIADFISKALFELMSITWDDFLRQALLSMPFGVMPFEKVFKIEVIDGKTMIVWKKFAPRLPTSITAWTAGGADGITQQLLNGRDALIPIEKLLIFVNEKEGDNWWGTSTLRAAYKPWYIKSNLEKIDAIAQERQGIGIPFVQVEATATAEDISKAKTTLKNLRSHENAYIIEPKDQPVEFKDMKANTTKDPSKSIAYHNRQIALSVLAQFLDLGSGGTGSRALSIDQTDLFLQSLEAIANGVKNVLDKFAIKQLVDLNFDNISEYPEVNFTGIARTDVEKLSVAYQRFTQSGGITPQENDDQFLRSLLDLPEADEKAKKKVVEKKNEKNNADDIDIEDLERHIFAETNEFKSFRKLTFAEKKVNWQSIQNFMDKNEKSMNRETRSALTKAKKDYIKRVGAAVASGNTQKVKTLQLQFKDDYAAIVKKFLKDAYIFGKNNVSKEMGVKTPAADQKILTNISLSADTIAKKHGDDLVNQAKLTIVTEVQRGQTVAQALKTVDTVLTQKILTLTRDTSSIVTAGHVNLGRKTVFDKNADKIYALQRSEILDKRTCKFCLSMDARIVKKNDPLAKIGTFHSHCRGIWVEILKGEAEKPPISGVPKSLRSRLGNSTNELVQPPKPIIKKDSAAAKKIKQGKAGQ